MSRRDIKSESEIQVIIIPKGRPEGSDMPSIMAERIKDDKLTLIIDTKQ